MKSRIKKKLEKLPPWLFSAACCGLILWFTLSPRPVGEIDINLFEGSDKVFHAIMFGGLTFCICLDKFRLNSFTSLKFRFIFCSAVASIILGGIIEILQSGMELGRSGDLIDFLADSAGAIFVAAIWELTCQYHERKHREE